MNQFDYQPPLSVDLVSSELTTETFENKVVSELKQKYKLNVDVQKLKRALAYDRLQYEQGFLDGYRAAKNELGDFVFNFPELTAVKAGVEDPIAKCHEELDEYIEAAGALKVLLDNEQLLRKLTPDTDDVIQEAREHMLEELLDFSHTVETLMRRYPKEDISRKRKEVIEKNKRRGYYKEV